MKTHWPPLWILLNVLELLLQVCEITKIQPLLSERGWIFNFFLFKWTLFKLFLLNLGTVSILLEFLSVWNLLLLELLCWITLSLSIDIRSIIWVLISIVKCCQTLVMVLIIIPCLINLFQKIIQHV